MPRWASRVLRAGVLVVAASHAVGGIDSEARYAMPNANFGLGLAGWTQSGAAPFDVAVGPGGTPAARIDLSTGQAAHLTYSLPVGPPGAPLARPAPGALGEPVAFGARVAFDAGAGGGDVSVRVFSFDGASETLLLESSALAASAASSGRYVALAALAPGGGAGRILTNTLELRIRIAVSCAGRTWIDGVVGGKRRPGDYRLVDPSFESPYLGGWSTVGDVALVDAGSGRAAYFGTRSVELGGPRTALVQQTLAIEGYPGAPWHQDAPFAGCWVHIEGDALLGSTPDPARHVELALYASTPGGARTQLASAVWAPSISDRGKWRFLATDAPSQDLGFAHVDLQVEVSKTFPGGARIDFVQVGESQAFTGNPRRIVTASYVGWYRSPLSPHALAQGQTPRQRWRNWYWTAPPFSDPTSTGLAHDPDCTTSPTCLRANGRRNGAVSELTGIDRLPLAGAYDSRDRDVVRWHVDLARAVGIDSFTYDWLGHTLSEQTVLPGEDAVGDDTLLALIDAADRPESDFKIGVMFEPKAHMLGWVAGETTFAERKQGIIDDLVWLVETLGHRRPLWRRDGRLVVFVFRHTVGGLTEADWSDVDLQVLLRTGEDLELVATERPALQDTPFDGFLSWRLVDPTILRYASYADFVAGDENWPAATSGDVRELAAEVDGVARGWELEDDDARFSLAMAWPGFDDTGVAGWGQPNGTGSDGQPLSVRVAWDLGVDFLNATFDAAIESDAEWVHVATWNDWNELTAIEPAWHPFYEQAAATGQRAAPDVVEAVLGRLLAVQAGTAAFKRRSQGTGSFGLDVEGVARAYVRAALGGQVPRYD
ncbi:MAG: hypothetical protein GY711_23250 [bacterium]|nr:hypothetical protein [bacterium]